MTMAKTIVKLRELSESELIAQHDRAASSTVVGTKYFLDELNRRDQNHLSQRMDKLTKRIYYLTVFIAILTALSVILVSIQVVPVLIKLFGTTP